MLAAKMICYTKVQYTCTILTYYILEDNTRIYNMLVLIWNTTVTAFTFAGLWQSYNGRARGALILHVQLKLLRSKARDTCSACQFVHTLWLYCWRSSSVCVRRLLVSRGCFTNLLQVSYSPPWESREAIQRVASYFCVMFTLFRYRKWPLTVF